MANMAAARISPITVGNEGTDNGSIHVEPGRKKHRKEEIHNGNKVRLFNYELFIKLSSQFIYRNFHTNRCMFVGFSSH